MAEEERERERDGGGRRGGQGGMSASIGAPCGDAGDGEQGGGGGEVTGCYRGHRLAKEHSPPSVDMRCVGPVMHKAGGRGGRVLLGLNFFSYFFY